MAQYSTQVLPPNYGEGGVIGVGDLGAWQDFEDRDDVISYINALQAQQQLMQNAYQYNNDSAMSQGRFDQQFDLERQNSAHNQGLSNRQQQLAELANTQAMQQFQQNLQFQQDNAAANRTEQRYGVDVNAELQRQQNYNALHLGNTNAMNQRDRNANDLLLGNRQADNARYGVDVNAALQRQQNANALHLGNQQNQTQRYGIDANAALQRQQNSNALHLGNQQNQTQLHLGNRQADNSRYGIDTTRDVSMSDQGLRRDLGMADIDTRMEELRTRERIANSEQQNQMKMAAYQQFGRMGGLNRQSKVVRNFA